MSERLSVAEAVARLDAISPATGMIAASNEINEVRGGRDVSTDRDAANAWLEHRACRDVPTDLFYPGLGKSVEPALRVCRRCPVQSECLVDALNDPLLQDIGVRGGLSQRQRRKLRPYLPVQPGGRRPISHGTEGGYRAHRRRGEVPCDECAQAARDAKNERRAANRLRAAS